MKLKKGVSKIISFISAVVYTSMFLLLASAAYVALFM